MAAEQSHFEHFITRDGATLKDGDKVFRFAGIHAPELHRIEDDARGTCKADSRGWGQYFRWPTAEEQENWIKALVQTGARAQRVYVLSVQQTFGRGLRSRNPYSGPGNRRRHAAPERKGDAGVRQHDRRGGQTGAAPDSAVLSITGGGGAVASSWRRSTTKSRRIFTVPTVKPSRPILM
ncbi:endo-b1,4-mannanase 5C [Klebsiella michiganensis]|uniref:Endo-b1,4-mannanase 5C n=1 Tax=Klebsiella michiganensis TaxID=1134687 RepID=A0A7H4PMI1_9ENTR|nr:endo-b1,4-mannanase 5C [Klebsiella michiganensis]